MQAFAQALNAEYFVDNEYHDSPPSHSPKARSINISQNHSPRTLRAPSGPNGNGSLAKRIRRISALSDFAPVNLRVRKRKKGATKSHERKQEWMFVLVRWPLLVSNVFVYIIYSNLMSSQLFILLFILFEFGIYILVRQCVNAKEWLTACASTN